MFHVSCAWDNEIIDGNLAKVVFMVLGVYIQTIDCLRYEAEAFLDNSLFKHITC